MEKGKKYKLKRDAIIGGILTMAVCVTAAFTQCSKDNEHHDESTTSISNTLGTLDNDSTISIETSKTVAKPTPIPGDETISNIETTPKVETTTSEESTIKNNTTRPIEIADEQTSLEFTWPTGPILPGTTNPWDIIKPGTSTRPSEILKPSEPTTSTTILGEVTTIGTSEQPIQTSTTIDTTKPPIESTTTSSSSQRPITPPPFSSSEPVGPKPTTSETKKPEPEPTTSETKKPEPKPTTSETKKPEPEPTTSETKKPEPKPTTSETKKPEPEPTTSETKKPEPEPTTSETKKPEPEPTTSETKKPEPEPTTSETKKPEPEPTTSETKKPEPEPPCDHKWTTNISYKPNSDGTHTVIKTDTCACGETIRTETTESHKFSEWVSAEEQGEKRICPDCGYIEYRRHDFKDNTSYEYVGNSQHKEITSHVCKTCGYTAPNTEKQAPCNPGSPELAANGNDVQTTCGDCRRVEVIHSHNTVTIKVPSTNGDVCYIEVTKCGDSSCPLLPTEVKTEIPHAWVKDFDTYNPFEGTIDEVCNNCNKSRTVSYTDGIDNTNPLLIKDVLYKYRTYLTENRRLNSTLCDEDLIDRNFYVEEPKRLYKSIH